MVLAAEAVEAGQWAPQDVQVADLPKLGAYVLSPKRVFNRGKPHL
jgi:hypothetical protein